MERRLSATKILARADIVYAGDLSAKDPSTLAIRERIAQENAAGAEHLMSAQNLHTKLDFLLQHTMHHASARLWIESFLFRITAMIQTDKQLVIGLEVFAAPEVITTTPPTIAIGAHVNYVLFFVDKRAAPRMLDAVNLESALRNKAQAVPGLFVAEAKGDSHMLGTHVPQAVVEMQACARRLKSTYIRGALTNGTSWIFLLLELDTSFLGGRYWESARQDVVIQSSGDRRWVDEESVDRMAALLAHWAKHCAEDLTEDDWFEKLFMVDAESGPPRVTYPTSYMGYADPPQPGTDAPDQGHALEDLRLYRLFLSATVALSRVMVDPSQRRKQPRPPRHLARTADGSSRTSETEISRVST
ncbi:uncharacterized protein TRAVEDRAFT_75294 [Trametes versicolor FP-101664 SS1]|uniref:uncharacterized protein n=1 Tax=Trametes versicolor (strain FP-101664) TaxID=717944 RepID=UPI0004621BE9|nr:uncharacterized protein TRAVEDRAFT_75294 [Trametes versicolor FP-101664 SS1]EIW52238.1 hypothetical protein TRAVEDRAFT_75294 [Trametes versicolor FP-101664 SS1]